MNQSAKIRVRGQTKATCPKKPFKIKFDKKQNIFGISGQFKKWTLLSSHYDKFLIRNISEKVGLKFTPKCEHFDAIFNGNFRDNYFVCD